MDKGQTDQLMAPEPHRLKRTWKTEYDVLHEEYQSKNDLYWHVTRQVMWCKG